jgi:transmembrane sensor
MEHQMPSSLTELDHAALEWVIRTGDPGFEDWERFTAWLADSPDHAARYHALSADADAMTLALLQQQRQQRTPSDLRPVPQPWHRRRWIGGAIAAALVAVIGVRAYDMRPRPYVIETAAGQTRVIPLADGSRVTLNGATRIALDRSDPRAATLEHGQALFDVRHNDRDPFEVAVGGDRLIDLGTRFDVSRVAGTTEVAVAEGAVMFNPDGERVRLAPGQSLRTVDGEERYQLARVDAASVGGWKAGRLDYAGTPLSDVADDISRATGTRLSLGPTVGARTFQGTILLDGLASHPERLGPLLNVRMVRDGDSWRLDALP